MRWHYITTRATSSFFCTSLSCCLTANEIESSFFSNSYLPSLQMITQSTRRPQSASNTIAEWPRVSRDPIQYKKHNSLYLILWLYLRTRAKWSQCPINTLTSSHEAIRLQYWNWLWELGKWSQYLIYLSQGASHKMSSISDKDRSKVSQN